MSSLKYSKLTIPTERSHQRLSCMKARGFSARRMSSEVARVVAEDGSHHWNPVGASNKPHEGVPSRAGAEQTASNRASRLRRRRCVRSASFNNRRRGRPLIGARRCAQSSMTRMPRSVARLLGARPLQEEATERPSIEPTNGGGTRRSGGRRRRQQSSRGCKGARRGRRRGDGLDVDQVHGEAKPESNAARGIGPF